MADTYIVAEIGTGHGGDLKRASDLIAAAAESGADCAKFQYVIADEIVHRASGLVQLPGGATPLHERFRALERPPAFYLELRALCDRSNVDFLCTPFGLESLSNLLRMGVDRLKLASPEINHTLLLEAMRESGVPVIVSTGVSRLRDIEYAVEILHPSQLTLLHCITAYPAPETEYNLRVIPALNLIFGAPVGLSDHSADPALVPGLAVALGASVVEKHFTLDRSADGLDDPIAADPMMFTEMAATIRRIDAIRSLDEKAGHDRVIAEFAAEYGQRRVEEVLGSGVKHLAPSEEENYATTRRTLHYTEDREAGAAVRARDVLVLRSEKNLSPGIEPRFANEVIGARLVRSVQSGEGVQWRDFIARS